MAFIKRIFRILFILTASVVVLHGLLYALLLSPYIQTKLTRYATEQIEAQSGVKLQIGGVDFRPMHSLVLNDVLLNDFSKDTLLYCKDLRVQIDSFNLYTQTFSIREIALDGAVFKLWLSKGDPAMTNIELLIDSLQRKMAVVTSDSVVPDSLSTGKSWLVGLQKIKLLNSRFVYRDEAYESVDYGVNWTDIDCRDFSLEVSGFDFTKSPLELHVSGLNLKEKSGLQIKNMKAQVRAGAADLLVTDCRFELERSSVDLIKLEYHWNPGQRDWKHFTKRMQQYYEMGPSSVSFIDLAYFNGILRGIDNTVKCSGIVTNTIEQLEGKDLYFELGENTVFQGSFKSSGLPDVWNTMFNIEMTKAHLDPRDLADIYLPWFEMKIPVPSPLFRLPYVDFERIRFDGTLSDFLVNAKSVTPALSGTLNFSYAPCEGGTPDDCSQMGGDFVFDRLDLRKFTDLSFLGNGSVTGKYSGTWDDRRGAIFQMKSTVEQLELNSGTVRNTDVAMALEGQQLDLMVTLNDKRVRGGVVTSYDMADTFSFLSVNGHLAMEALGDFGWALKGGDEWLSTSFDLIYAGRKEKNFMNITLSDFCYAHESDSLRLANLSIEDSRYNDRHATTLKSDLLDLSAEGVYDNLEPLAILQGALQNYLPAYSGSVFGVQTVGQGRGMRSMNGKGSKSRKGRVGVVDFDCVVEVKALNPAFEVLCPGLRVSEGSRVVAAFRGDGVKLEVAADTLVYKDVKLLGSRVSVSGDERRMKVYYNGDKMLYGDGYQLYNLHDELTLADNRIDNRLCWSNWQAQTYSGDLSARVEFKPNDKRGHTTEIDILPGVIVMEDSVWNVQPSRITIEGKEITVNEFSIRRANEFLLVRGRLSEIADESLEIRLMNFNLEHLARVALKRHLKVFGMATGSLTIQDYYKDFLLLSDFNIRDWGVNRDTLGSLHLRSYWDTEDQNLIVRAENRIGAETPLMISGYYKPSTDTLSVNMRLKRVELERLGIYASDWVSDARGALSGELKIFGNARQPDISGVIKFDSVRMNIKMLNTSFLIHDSIRVVKNRLLFDHFVLRDAFDREAVVKGDYRIWENRYRLNVAFDGIRVLNTGFADNESFYGQLYLSGMADLNNQNGRTSVTINTTTERDSRLYIPLTATGAKQESNFLHFVNPARPVVPKVREINSYADVNLNVNLEVNDNLNVQVIFDPTVGDILRTSGRGNIKLAFDKEGSVSMLGEYRISKGDYLFTLSNLVNKKFTLTPGGTINWTGSPYDAAINLNAVYSLKTTITELLPVDQLPTTDEGDGETKTEAGRKVPVECILNLSEQLTNPTVKFDINFPTLEMQSKSYIESLFSSQDELNKQMFSLLVLNCFYRQENITDYGLQAQTMGVTTVTEMMSNQLSRWLSQISNNVDVGVAYRMGDPAREISSDEIEVALSTQLLNDRITISANGNMDVGGTRNAATTDTKKTNIAGDFDVEVKLNKPGTLKLKAYSHTDEKLINNNTETIQGVGVSYQESFDTFRELVRRYVRFLKKKK